jgi:hypothetical protein
MGSGTLDRCAATRQEIIGSSKDRQNVYHLHRVFEVNSHEKHRFKDSSNVYVLQRQTATTKLLN